MTDPVKKKLPSTVFMYKKTGTPLFWMIRTFALLFLTIGRSLRKSRTRIFISYAPLPVSDSREKSHDNSKDLKNVPVNILRL